MHFNIRDCFGNSMLVGNGLLYISAQNMNQKAPKVEDEKGLEIEF